MLPTVVASLLAFAGFGWLGSSQQGQVFQMGGQYWSVARADSGTGIDFQPSRVVVGIPPSTGAARVELQSKCSFLGDYDVAVNFELLNWPKRNGGRVVLGGPEGNVQLISAENGNSYFISDFGRVQRGLELVTTRGSLRLVRQGNTTTALHGNGDQWVPIDSYTGNSRAGNFAYLRLATDVLSSIDPVVSFYNYQATGELSCPASAPPAPPADATTPPAQPGDCCTPPPPPNCCPGDVILPPPPPPAYPVPQPPIQPPTDPCCEPPPPCCPDDLPPVTTIDLGDLGDCFTHDVTVTFNASDNKKVGAVYYQINGGAWLTYEAPFILNTEGHYAISFYAVDTSGNREQTKVRKFTIDKTAPSIRILQPVPGTHYLDAEDVRVLVQATDNLTKQVQVAATLDGVPIQNGDTIDLATLPLGQHVLVARARDNCGNESEVVCTFYTRATIGSIQSLIVEFRARGWITSSLDPLKAALDQAQRELNRGNAAGMASFLEQALNAVTADAGTGIAAAAADILARDIRYVIGNPG